MASEWAKSTAAGPPPVEGGGDAPTVHGVLVAGLTALCKPEQAELTDLQSVRWLGRWLKENNPRKPLLGEAGAADYAAAAPAAPSSSSTASSSAKLPNGGSKLAPPRNRPPQVTFLLGGPAPPRDGSAPSIAERAAARYGHAHVSMAQLASGADAAAAATVGGKVALLKRWISKGLYKSKVVIEGFPRSLEEALAFEQSAAGCNASVLQITGGGADCAADVVGFYGGIGRLRAVASAADAENTVAAVAAALAPAVTFAIGCAGAGAAKRSAARPTTARASALQLLGAAHGLEVVSVAGAIEATLTRGGAAGNALRALLESGLPLGPEVVVGLLQGAMRRVPSSRFLVADFPLSVAQAAAFEAAVGVQPELVLDLGGGGGAGDAEATAALRELYEGAGTRWAVPCADGPNDAELAARAAAALAPRYSLVMGGPSSGKTALCAALAATAGFVHLSPSALLKAEVARGSAVGVRVNEMIREGAPVPAAVPLALLVGAMRGVGAAPRNSRFVLDDFPRSAEHAEGLLASVGPPEATLLLSCGRAAAQARTSAVDGATFEERAAAFEAAKEAVVGALAPLGTLASLDAGQQGGADAVRDAALACLGGSGVVFALGSDDAAVAAAAAAAADSLGCTGASLSALLQAAISRGSARGDAIDAHLKRGQIVPLALTLDLLGDAVAAANGRGLVVTGFPRAVDEAEAFEARFGECRTVLRVGEQQEQDEAKPVLEYFSAKGAAKAVPSAGAADAVRALFQPTLVSLHGDASGAAARRLGAESGFCSIRAASVLARAAGGGGEVAAAMEQARARGWALPAATVVALLKRHMAATGLSKFALHGFPAVTPGGQKPYVHEQDNEMARQVAPIARLAACGGGGAGQAGEDEDAQELLGYFERTGRLSASADDILGACRAAPTPPPTVAEPDEAAAAEEEENSAGL
jgi:adenylate kinase family enzyme